MSDIVFRGATPTQEFEIPFVRDHVSAVHVSYRQNETPVLLKRISTGFTEPTPGVTAFSYRLTQAETLKFLPNALCYVQINVLLDDGTREPSYEMVFRTGKQFYSEVLT